jgi:uncharacterized protein YjgD (DUF1641 family)
MWWEETEASHVYCYIQRSTGKKMVYHAVGSGTTFWGYEKFLEVNKPVYEKIIEVSDATYDKVVDKLIDGLHRKYSKKHLFGLFIKRLVQYISKSVTKTAKIIANPFKDKEASEVCIEALCMAVDTAEIVRQAEDPEDMGMYEAILMLKALPGEELKV